MVIRNQKKLYQSQVAVIKSMAGYQSGPGGDDLPAWLLPYSSSQSPPHRGLLANQGHFQGGTLVYSFVYKYKYKYKGKYKDKYSHLPTEGSSPTTAISKVGVCVIPISQKWLYVVDCRHYAETNTKLLVLIWGLWWVHEYWILIISFCILQAIRLQYHILGLHPRSIWSSHQHTLCRLKMLFHMEYSGYCCRWGKIWW